MKKRILLLSITLIFFSILKCAGQREHRDTLILGGAFRYTYMNTSWNEAHKDKGGQVVFDTFILNAKGEIKGLDFAVEARYYAEAFGGLMLRNGYVGLPLTKDLKLKLGMPRTPFGILPYTGNSFMFNMPYYLGFEDDADFGGLLEYNYNTWNFQLNFAKNSEDVFSQKNNRYAYDISGDHQELNQLTGRIVYHIGKSEIGYSGQVGHIYNTKERSKGTRFAHALHALWRYKAWDVKAQIMYYDFSPKDSFSKDFIRLGAFGADYKVARKGISNSLSIAYNLPINHLLLNDIKFYNDFSSLHKQVGEYDDTYMNVTGCMLHTGPIYMLVDYVLAKNHPWIGTHYEDAFLDGTQSKWEKRFNICLGVYF